MAWVAGPATRVERVREEAFTLARYRVCDGCGADTECARLEPLAVDEQWYCGRCWDYQLGRIHGRRQATQDLVGLISEYGLR
jgi:hypothetical protein